MKKHIALFTLGVASNFLLGSPYHYTEESVFSVEDAFQDNQMESVFSRKNPKDVFQTKHSVFLNDAPRSTPSYNMKNWMEENRTLLNKKPFYKIVLPGTHDAGAYGLNRKSETVNLPKFLKKIRKLVWWLPGDGVVSRWSNTQKLTIGEQLNAGVRYFDLRICQCGDKDFYLYHGLRGPNLEPVLQTFSDFLKNNKGEIIILDMSHFFGVSHEKLLNLINKYLASFYATKSDICDPVTYEELIKQNKRCFVYYHEESLTQQHPFLLGDSDSHWANKTKVKDLIKDLEEYHSTYNHNSPWILQYVLTPDTKYVVKNPWGSVEDLAEKTHKHMKKNLKGFQKKFPLNIIMLDFVNESLCKEIVGLNF